MRKTNLLLRSTALLSLLAGVVFLIAALFTAMSSHSVQMAELSGRLQIYLDRTLTWEAAKIFGTTDLWLAVFSAVFGVSYLLLGVSGLTARKQLGAVLSAVLIVLLVLAAFRTGLSLLISADFLLLILYLIGSLSVGRR